MIIAWRLYNAEGVQIDNCLNQTVEINDPKHWTNQLIGLEQGALTKIKSVSLGTKVQYKVQIKEVLPYRSQQ